MHFRIFDPAFPRFLYFKVLIGCSSVIPDIGVRAQGMPFLARDTVSVQ